MTKRDRRTTCWFTLAALVGLALAGPGGHCAPPRPKPAARAAKAAAPRLPEWAPKKPSKEFLRAAAVLKPLPDEIMLQLLRRAGHRNPEWILRHFKGNYIAGWEFFGSLTDRQIQRYQATGEFKAFLRDLPKAQQAALNRFIDRKAELDGRNQRVIFYKMGAKKDLSNVGVRIWREEHFVNIGYRVRDLATGKEQGIECDPIAVW